MSRAGELTLKQLQVRILALGLPAFVLCGAAAALVLRHEPNRSLSQAQALVLTARWLLVPALCLLVGVFFAAAWRFTHKDDNAGSAETCSPILEIALRYNRNTLEQGFMAGAGWLALAVSFPHYAEAALPLLAGLFALGRISFWIGYLWARWARAFGFAVTVLPTSAVLIFLSVSLLMGI